MANKRPRILIVGPRGLFGCEGGIEKFTDSFVPRTLKHADIDVLTIIPPDRPLPEGLKAINVPRSKKFKTDKAMYLLYALSRHATQKYDHVFIFGTNFAVLVPFLRMMFWRRAKIHLRSGSVDHVLSKWGPVVRKLLVVTEGFCRYADTVIAVAPSIQTHLSTLGIKAHLIRNGVDKPEGGPPKAERKPNTLVAVGRVTVQKNYKVLIGAAQILGARSPDITIIGGADLSDEAQALKSMIRPQDRITFTGALKREEVFSHLLTHALYINCSIHEGMSNAVLEAVQQGIPVILSDIDANRDLALDGRFYFDPENPQALADKILEALAEPAAFTVPPETFDDWDTAIERMLKLTGVIA